MRVFRQLLSILLCLSFTDISGATQLTQLSLRQLELIQPSLMLDYPAEIQQYVNFGGLTFYKNYEDLTTGQHVATDLDADFSIGSATATFTCDRSTSSPGTYIDDNGVIQLCSATDNTARVRGGYYDATGFHAQKGLMVEGSGTNYLKQSIFATDTNSDGISDNWSKFENCAGATIETRVSDNTFNLSNHKVTRMQYAGNPADNNSSYILYSDNTDVGSFAQGDMVVVSVWIKGSTTAGNVVIGFREFDSSAVAGTTHYSSSILSSISSEWKKFTYTLACEDADCDRVDFRIGISGDIDANETVDLYVSCPQLEKMPYATSFIPTTTAALTRGAETLKYALAGNRTVASESIFVKFSPMGHALKNGVHYLSSTDIKDRKILAGGAGGWTNCQPNATDSSGCSTFTGDDFLSNISYVTTVTCSHNSPYVLSYTDGLANGLGDTSDDFTNNAWGTYFYIGSSSVSVSQIDGIIQSCAFYSDAKGAADVSQITALLQ